jgi:mannose-6-phosphate isomerase-like protein (cupin superfamily)
MMDTRRLPDAPDTLAPDGSEIRLLVALTRGSMVHCTLPPGGVSRAVRHRTVEELWCVVGGRGELWRRRGEREETVALAPGVALSLPAGTHFQFRTLGGGPLEVVIVTMPPWPGEEEAERVAGRWPASA